VRSSLSLSDVGADFAKWSISENAGQKSYRGEQLSSWWRSWASWLPTFTGTRRVHVMGNVVAVELSIRGTFTGPFESPAGVTRPTRAKLDIAGADF
jgi:hypothetical protein